LKSFSGYVFTLGGVVVSWKIYKQMCIAKSMIELDFITLYNVREELSSFETSYIA
jgi:hypothetical protein